MSDLEKLSSELRTSEKNSLKTCTSLHRQHDLMASKGNNKYQQNKLPSTQLLLQGYHGTPQSMVDFETEKIHKDPVSIQHRPLQFFGVASPAWQCPNRPKRRWAPWHNQLQESAASVKHHEPFFSFSAFQLFSSWRLGFPAIHQNWSLGQRNLEAPRLEMLAGPLLELLQPGGPGAENQPNPFGYTIR